MKRRVYSQPLRRFIAEGVLAFSFLETVKGRFLLPKFLMQVSLTKDSIRDVPKKAELCSEDMEEQNHER
jgi:hypothetical protein